MSVVICERCDGWIDTDFDVELKWTKTGAIHWHCLEDFEQDEEEKKEEERVSPYGGEFSPEQLKDIARWEKEDPRGQEGP